tara:strand:- start:271 stop:933 length:663 start_codon:yes stop_codon:yes gene_type:complete
MYNLIISKDEISNSVFTEYWFISWPIIILICLIFFYLEIKKFKKEEILLEKMGFNRSTNTLKLSLPLKSRLNQGINRNPITSEKYPHILIYLREISDSDSGAHRTRIIRLKSKRNNKFPQFTLRKESFFDKLRKDIDYRSNPEFSNKFFLKSLGDNENKMAVEKLFKNFSLQKKLLLNPMNIESNGNEIFYYWEGVKFPVEELPKKISEVEFLHDNFFDV